jgi:hypothetical protein
VQLGGEDDKCKGGNNSNLSKLKSELIVQGRVVFEENPIK